MIKRLLFLALISSTFLSGQIVQDSATYQVSSLGVQQFTFPNINSVSNCTDTLVVNIPNNNWIYSIDLYYDVTTTGTGFGAPSPDDVGTYLELRTQSIKEAGLSYGNLGTQNSTESVARTGLNFANGLATNGKLEFFLHAFRNSFGGSACDTLAAKIDKGTFKIIVNHGPAPTCFRPTAPLVNWATNNKANVGWTTGGATNWQIEYGTTGFTPGSGTLINATSNPFSITGLTQNTAYDFYVRDSCGTGDVSQWSIGETFTTICDPLTFTTSYLEDFEGANWSAGTGANNANNDIETCWERDPEEPQNGFGGDFAWGTGTGATPSAATGPSAAHAGTKYVYTEASAGGNQDVATLTSPLIAISGLTVPALEFYYHRFGASVGNLRVQMWSQATGWTDVWSVTGAQNQTASTDAWIKESVTINQYNNDTVRIRFYAVRSFQIQGDLAIDELSIKEAPSCPKPSNLNLISRTESSIRLGWTAVNATSWNIEYGAKGFTKGSGTTITVNSNPTDVGGLSSATAYDFYLRERCSATDTSEWIGPISGKTLCSTALIAPITEDFDGTTWVAGTGTYTNGDAIDNCWFRSPDSGFAATSPYWWGVRSAAGTTPATGPNADYSGTGNYVYTEASSGSLGQEALFESPKIDISALTNPELTFYYHMFGNAMGSLDVEVYSFTSNSWSTSIFNLTGQQQTSGAAAWVLAEVSLSAYLNDTIIIRFKGTKGNERRGDMAIDEFVVHDGPTCPDPRNLSFVSSTGTSATLSWTTGGASDWNIAVGAIGFTPGASFTATTANPATIGSLTAGTTYEAYVRDSCGTADVSAWIGPIVFSTKCLPIAAPTAENFDGASWVLSANQAVGTLDACWSRTDTNEYFWKAQSGTTPTNNTGPTGDHTSGSGKYLFSETNTGFAGGNTTTTLESPLYDLSPLTTPELTFWYHTYGTLINRLDVEVYDGSNWTIEATINQSQTSNAAAWEEEIVDLSSYSNDTIILRFVAYRNPGFNNQVDIAIDDLDLHEKPSCPAPTNLSSSGRTATSVSLDWTSSGATSWQIEYGSVGFVNGSGTKVLANTNPFTVTALAPNTNYDFYVREVCGASDSSAWLGPIDVSTLCTVVSAPFIENFDGPSYSSGANQTPGTIDNCWLRSDTVRYYWKANSGLTPTVNTGPLKDHTSGNGQYAFTEANNGGPTALSFTDFETPFVDISTLTNPELRYFYHMFGSLINKLEVYVNNGGANWTIVDTITGAQQTAQADPWEVSSVDLSAYANDTISVRFRAYRNNGFNNQVDISIDDVSLDEAVNCFAPTALVTSSPTTTSIDLSWTSGGATNWQIEYGPSGFAKGTGTIINVTSAPPYTVTGLSPSTYYEFYVRDSCGTSNVSDWSNSIITPTSCGIALAPYSENFDIGFNPGVNTATSQNDSSTIGACWTRNRDSAYFWGGGTGATPTGGTGPFFDHTTGLGNYAYVESSFATGQPVAVLTSPEIDLSPLTDPQLSFWYHMNSQAGPTNTGTLRWDIKSGTSWVALDSVTSGQGNQWNEVIVDLTAYINLTVQIRFRTTRSAGATPQQGDIAIDDVLIDEAPSCPDPSALIASNPSLTSVDLSWTTGGAADWLVGYRTLGSTGPLTIIPSSSNTSFVLAGLSASSSYEIYVKDSCGTGTTSAWIGPEVASTLCDIFVAPFFESFDDGVWAEGTGFLNNNDVISACWTRSNNDSIRWTAGTGPTGSNGTGPLADVSGSGNYIYTEASIGAGISEILSPRIELTSGISSPKLYFNYHMYGNAITSLKIDLNSNGGAFSTLKTITGQVQLTNGAAWISDSIDISSYSGDTIQIRFVGENTGIAGDISIDEVAVRGLLACNDPSNLSVSNIQQNSMDVSWTSNNVGGNSSIKYYELAAGPGSATTVNNAVSPYTMMGLNPNSAYSIEVLDTCFSSIASVSLFDTVSTIPCVPVSAAYVFSTTNLSVNFNANSSTNADSIFWDFGNASTASGFTPSHTYAAAGKYLITMIAFSDCGVSDTLMDSIQVCDALVAAFTHAISGSSVNFDASSSANASGYLWDFGDGNTSSGVMTSNTYASSGNFTVTLRIYNDCGDTISETRTIGVCGPPTASWTYSILSSGANGMLVQFDGSASLNATVFDWDYGDGNTASGSAIPQHTYATPGLFYLVKLRVENNCGSSDSKTFRLSQIGLTEYNLNTEWNIYPNPAVDIINIQMLEEHAEIYKLRVIDMNGKLVLEMDNRDNLKSIPLDISNLSKGQYFVEIEGSNGFGLKPIQKQ